MSINEVVTFWKEWEKKRDGLPFEIDGVVVKVDSLDQQLRLWLDCEKSALGDRKQVRFPQSGDRFEGNSSPRWQGRHAHASRGTRTGVFER